MRTSKNKFFVILTGLGVLLRLFSFFPSVINHDESTYLVIANALTKGALYYVDVIDLKPPGIFYVLGIFIKLVGNHIFLIRFLVTMVVVLTAYLVYLIKLKREANERSARASAIIYLFFTSIFTFYGVSPNTELFFNLFTVMALMFIHKHRMGWFFLAGISLGIGFVIKYMVAFDALTFGLLILYIAYSEKKVLEGVKKVALMVIGFCLPIAGVVLYYYSKGHLETLLYYTFKVSSGYSESLTFMQNLTFIADFHLRFFPIVLMAVLAMIYSFRKRGEHTNFTFYTLWYVLVLVAILLPQKTFGHYFIQAMLPISFIAGDFFSRYPNFMARKLGAFSYLSYTVTLLVVLNMVLQWRDYYLKTDYPREVATYLESQLDADDVLYTGHYHHIIYFLLDKSSPTPYVHRSILFTDNLSGVLGLDLDEEFNKIADKNPDYFLMDRDTKISLQKYFTGSYVMIREFDNGVQVFKKTEQP